MGSFPQSSSCGGMNFAAIAHSQLTALMRRLELICPTVHPNEDTFSAFGHSMRNLLGRIGDRISVFFMARPCPCFSGLGTTGRPTQELGRFAAYNATGGCSTRCPGTLATHAMRGALTESNSRASPVAARRYRLIRYGREAGSCEFATTPAEVTWTRDDRPGRGGPPPVVL